MKRTLIAILTIICVAVAMASVAFASTRARAAAPDSSMSIAAPPSSTPTDLAALLASPWDTMACADIDPGLWKGRLFSPDGADQPTPKQLGDAMVQPLPNGVIPMPNACLPKGTSPATQTESLRLVNTTLP